MERKKIRIGELLLSKKLITKEELEHAIKLQKQINYAKPLGEILVEEGFITEKVLMEQIAEQMGIEFIELYSIELKQDLIDKFPFQVLKNAMAVPIDEDEYEIKIATSDPLNYDALESLEKYADGKLIKLYLTTKEEIFHVFNRIETHQSTRKIIEMIKYEMKEGRLSEDSSISSVMKLIRLIIKVAIDMGASDIHIEPNSYDVSIRMRKDGILKEAFLFDVEIFSALSSRIKILGNLDISEKRRSQDGRFELVIDGKSYDFRLSTVPTLYGESIVIRILDRQKVLLKMSELGFENRSLKILEDIIRQPYGIILLTGPTGSGKTTTLYAALNEIKSIENKVMTIEDPIEYSLPLIQQVQVNEAVGYTFAEALKSFLRQDPDVIMIGEIRDLETLSAAIQASLTGHLVFSTLHTNDAPGAIGRMIQMGMQNYLIADSLLAVVAQRLVRKICPYCKKEVKYHKNILTKVEKLLPKNYRFYKGMGCEKCEMSGYIGRTVISEIFKVDDLIAQKITDGASKIELTRYAIKNGLYRPMIIDGLSKVLNGVTTLDEILRVARS